MVNGQSVFNDISASIISTFTFFINSYSGILQVTIYFVMLSIFGFTLVKIYQVIRALAHCDSKKIKKGNIYCIFESNYKTPLSIIAANTFLTAQNHYLKNNKNCLMPNIIPPEPYIRDAAYQFSERYFETKFLEPVSMLANLMPPLGFIGTILGMVIQFLSNTGNLKNDIAIAGIATALYTTFIALIFYTFLELLKRLFFTLAQKRIDEGLALVADSQTSLRIGEINES